MMPHQRQKLYGYVDETGQDDASSVFIVVVVLSDRDQEELREGLISIEQHAGVGRSKWHDAKPARRLRYIELALERKLGQEEVFFGSYPKPLPYLLPMIEVLERAIKAKAAPSYSARVFVDGIDRKKAAELTNALRLHGISLEMVRSRRDESEPTDHPLGRYVGWLHSQGTPQKARGIRALATGGARKLHQTHKRKNPLNQGAFS